MLGSCSAKGCLSRSFTSLSPSPKCLARFHIWNARSRLATQTDDQLKHGKVPPEWCSVLYYYQMNLLDFCSFYCRAFLLFFFVPSTFLLPFTLLFSPILFVSLALVSGVLYFVVSFFSLFVHAFCLSTLHI